MTSIDSIIRAILLQKSMPMHFYVKLLSFALDCLKELELDIVPNIKSQELTVDEFSRVVLPCDYVDWTRVGQKNGQFVLNMSTKKTFNRMLNTSDSGLVIPFAEPSEGANLTYSYIDRYYDNYAGLLGGQYGLGTGTQHDEFMELDGCLQLSTQYVAGDKIVLDYIWFDKANTETSVHKYAEATIKAYAEWRLIEGIPKINAYDKRAAKDEYDNQQRILVARLNSLDTESVSRILDKRRKLSI